MISAIQSSASSVLAASRSIAMRADTIVGMRTNGGVAEAMVGLTLDEQQFKASLAVIRTASDMAGMLLNEEV